MGLLVSAPAAAVLTWLSLWLLARIAADPPYPAEEVPALVERFVALRVLVALLALPSFLCGIALLRRSRRPRDPRAVASSAASPGGGQGRTWTIAFLGGLALLVPFGIVMYCFIALLAPAYAYRPIG